MVRMGDNMNMNIDTRQLETLEFQLLAGTELMVHLIRNRIKFKCDTVTLEQIYEYLDQYSRGNYYIRNASNSITYIYFENLVDKEQLVEFLRQYSITNN
jgi:hypothetical protein